MYTLNEKRGVTRKLFIKFFTIKLFFWIHKEVVFIPYDHFRAFIGFLYDNKLIILGIVHSLWFFQSYTVISKF